MATGPEHYREAERIVSLIDQGRIGQDMANSLAKAQVHATLALAAATALNDADGGAPVADWDVWKAVAGEDAEQQRRAEQAARDAEAADDAMSTSERLEHDQADEARLDATGWGQGGAPF